MMRTIALTALFCCAAAGATQGAKRGTGRELAERWWNAKPAEFSDASAFRRFSADIGALDQQEFGSLLRELDQIQTS